MAYAADKLHYYSDFNFRCNGATNGVSILISQIGAKWWKDRWSDCHIIQRCGRLSPSLWRFCLRLFFRIWESSEIPGWNLCYGIQLSGNLYPWVFGGLPLPLFYCCFAELGNSMFQAVAMLVSRFWTQSSTYFYPLHWISRCCDCYSAFSVICLLSVVYLKRKTVRVQNLCVW